MSSSETLGPSPEPPQPLALPKELLPVFGSPPMKPENHESDQQQIPGPPEWVEQFDPHLQPLISELTALGVPHHAIERKFIYAEDFEEALHRTIRNIRKWESDEFIYNQAVQFALANPDKYTHTLGRFMGQVRHYTGSHPPRYLRSIIFKRLRNRDAFNELMQRASNRAEEIETKLEPVSRRSAKPQNHKSFFSALNVDNLKQSIVDLRPFSTLAEPQLDKGGNSIPLIVTAPDQLKVKNANVRLLPEELLIFNALLLLRGMSVSLYDLSALGMEAYEVKARLGQMQKKFHGRRTATQLPHEVVLEGRKRDEIVFYLGSAISLIDLRKPAPKPAEVFMYERKLAGKHL